MLLDSGAPCSLNSQQKHIQVQEISPGQPIQLVNADGRDFTPLGTSMTMYSGDTSSLLMPRPSPPE